MLRNIRREDLVRFFETLYRPENIIVTVTGDLGADEALAIVGRTFGTIPRGTLRKAGGPREPDQAALRFGRSEGDIKEGYTAQYGRNFVLGVPLDNVDRTVAAVPGLSVESMQAVARKYFAGDNYVYGAVRGK